MPAGQLAHVALPSAAAKVPAGQALQVPELLAPAAALYVPTGQEEQAALPVAAAKVPAGQALQEAAAREGLKVPMEQEEQADEPLEAEEPGAQVRHADADDEPVEGL